MVLCMWLKIAFDYLPFNQVIVNKGYHPFSSVIWRGNGSILSRITL